MTQHLRVLGIHLTFFAATEGKETGIIAQGWGIVGLEKKHVDGCNTKGVNQMNGLFF